MFILKCSWDKEHFKPQKLCACIPAEMLVKVTLFPVVKALVFLVVIYGCEN